MKQQIENIIKENLPEKKENTDNKYDIYSEQRRLGFNQALSQIDTSLIADEVLKVVVEKIKEYIQEEISKGTWNADSIGKELLEIINYK